MPEHFLYLTTIGRTSGLPREIEIWFVERLGRHYLISEHREESGWVKNLRARSTVRFSVGTRQNHAAGLAETPARARVIDDEEEPELATAVRALMDARYRWSEGLIVELTPER